MKNVTESVFSSQCRLTELEALSWMDFTSLLQSKTLAAIEQVEKINGTHPLLRLIWQKLKQNPIPVWEVIAYWPHPLLLRRYPKVRMVLKSFDLEYLRSCLNLI